MSKDRDQLPGEVIDPNDPAQLERLAEAAYWRTCRLISARKTEGTDSNEVRWYCTWDALPLEQQEPYRAAVEAVVSLVAIERRGRGPAAE